MTDQGPVQRTAGRAPVPSTPPSNTPFSYGKREVPNARSINFEMTWKQLVQVIDDDDQVHDFIDQRVSLTMIRMHSMI